MFPTQSKVHRSSGLWLLPVVALAMLLVGFAVFASNSAQAQTVSGDVCIEGLVIDWEEKPLAGWVVTLTSDISGFTTLTDVSAPKPEDDDEYEYKGNDKNSKGKKYNFEYPEVEPDLEKGEFEFTDDEISDAITPTGGVQTGVFTVEIESRAGWEGVTPTSISFPIEAGQDGCVKIRFKMRQIVPVLVYKIDADHTPLEDWIIRAVPGPGNLFASPQEEETSETFTTTIDAGTPPTPTVIVTGGVASFTLTPGLWIFTEQAPKQDSDDPQNSYVPVVPPNGRQELLIPDDLAPGEPITVVFKNQLVTGCFIVRKEGLTNEPTVLGESYSVAGWGFKLLRKDGTVARQGVTDAMGELLFDNLPLGPYVIVEEDRPGWNEVTARQYDINVEGNMCEEPDELVVTFQNEQDDSGFCIEGRKIDANGGYGLADWEISIDPLAEGGYDPDNVFTDGLGEFEIDFPGDDYRIPGAEYEICEQGQDGWLPHNPTCQTVRLPEWPGACVYLEDFVNQQVGHSESEYHDDHGKGGGYPEGPSNGPEGGSPPSGPSNGPAYGNSGQQCSTYHVVQAGEGLYEIGREYQKSPQEMLDANPQVRDGDELWVYEGQKICIP